MYQKESGKSSENKRQRVGNSEPEPKVPEEDRRRRKSSNKESVKRDSVQVGGRGDMTEGNGKENSSSSDQEELEEQPSSSTSKEVPDRNGYQVVVYEQSECWSEGWKEPEIKGARKMWVVAIFYFKSKDQILNTLVLTDEEGTLKIPVVGQSCNYAVSEMAEVLGKKYGQLRGAWKKWLQKARRSEVQCEVEQEDGTIVVTQAVVNHIKPVHRYDTENLAEGLSWIPVELLQPTQRQYVQGVIGEDCIKAWDIKLGRKKEPEEKEEYDPKALFKVIRDGKLLLIDRDQIMIGEKVFLWLFDGWREKWWEAADEREEVKEMVWVWAKDCWWRVNPADTHPEGVLWRQTSDGGWSRVTPENTTWNREELNELLKGDTASKSDESEEEEEHTTEVEEKDPEPRCKEQSSKRQPTIEKKVDRQRGETKRATKDQQELPKRSTRPRANSKDRGTQMEEDDFPVDRMRVKTIGRTEVYQRIKRGAVVDDEDQVRKLMAAVPDMPEEMVGFNVRPLGYRVGIEGQDGWEMVIVDVNRLGQDDVVVWWDREFYTWTWAEVGYLPNPNIKKTMDETMKARQMGICRMINASSCTSNIDEDEEEEDLLGTYGAKYMDKVIEIREAVQAAGGGAGTGIRRQKRTLIQVLQATPYTGKRPMGEEVQRAMETPLLVEPIAGILTNRPASVQRPKTVGRGHNSHRPTVRLHLEEMTRCCGRYWEWGNVLETDYRGLNWEEKVREGDLITKVEGRRRGERVPEMYNEWTISPKSNAYRELMADQGGWLLRFDVTPHTQIALLLEEFWINANMIGWGGKGYRRLVRVADGFIVFGFFNKIRAETDCDYKGEGRWKV